MAFSLHSLSKETRNPASATARVLTELQLYGYRPGQEEADPRPLPEAEPLEAAINDIFDILKGVLADTRLEPDFEELAWSLTDIFHRKAGRIQRQLEDNEDRQARAREEQDGSEIRANELERLIAEGQSLIERQRAFEAMREMAAERFEADTASAWRPRMGSAINRKTMTAAYIDSKDFVAARRYAETHQLAPKGTKIAFTGGMDYADANQVWATLDLTFAKYPDMVLLHGGSPKGAEKAAAAWADKRSVPQVVFKPDWQRHGKAAPFRRNDAMLEMAPKGVIVFPGNGINDNLADKAKKLGIPVKDMRQSDARKGGA